MSKIYFTKYLPFDGKFKEGFCKNIATNEIIYYNGNYGETRPEELEPIKLMLCSRDINVGEMAWHNGELKEVTEDVLSFARKFGYKINGEVSPKAIWVKEGDEFDEHEVYFYAKHRSFPDMNFRFNMLGQFEEMEEKDKLKYTVFCEILCQNCKTYH
jgi:hypothetical protein